MAVRPVFVPMQRAPFFRPVEINFSWNGGFALVQSRKNIKAMHDGFNRFYPGVPVLEISSKSWQEHGKELSAFNMEKRVGDKYIKVECIYQAGKIFRDGGPYLDLLESKPKDAKRDERLKNSGPLTGFVFDGRRFPLHPENMFYNYIWINALMENQNLANVVLQYGAFTDIVFSSNSINCQAAAAAVYVALHKLGLLEQVKTAETFYKLLTDKDYVNELVDVESDKITEAFNLKLSAYRPVPDPYAEKLKASNKTTSDIQVDKLKATEKVGPGTSLEKEKEKPSQPKIAMGDVVEHKKFGKGNVIEVTESAVKIEFPDVGVKLLDKAWVTDNCVVVK